MFPKANVYFVGSDLLICCYVSLPVSLYWQFSKLSLCPRFLIKMNPLLTYIYEYVATEAQWHLTANPQNQDEASSTLFLMTIYLGHLTPIFSFIIIIVIIFSITLMTITYKITFALYVLFSKQRQGWHLQYYRILMRGAMLDASISWTVTQKDHRAWG